MKNENEPREQPEAEIAPPTLPAVIDRFEGEIAVLYVGEGETEQKFDVPRRSLPKGAKAGTHLRVQVVKGELIWAEIDEAATESTKLRIEDNLARLRRGDHLKG